MAFKWGLLTTYKLGWSSKYLDGYRTVVMYSLSRMFCGNSRQCPIPSCYLFGVKSSSTPTICVSRGFFLSQIPCKTLKKALASYKLVEARPFPVSRYLQLNHRKSGHILLRIFHKPTTIGSWHCSKWRKFVAVLLLSLWMIRNVMITKKYASNKLEYVTHGPWPGKFFLNVKYIRSTSVYDYLILFVCFFLVLNGIKCCCYLVCFCFCSSLFITHHILLMDRIQHQLIWYISIPLSTWFCTSRWCRISSINSNSIITLKFFQPPLRLLHCPRGRWKPGPSSPHSLASSFMLWPKPETGTSKAGSQNSPIKTHLLSPRKKEHGTLKNTGVSMEVSNFVSKLVYNLLKGLITHLYRG